MLVEIIGKRYEEKLITTSLKVAEKFEKEHRHVLDAIRTLTADELAQIEAMEMLVSSLINCGWGYDQIKSFVQENNVKQLAG